MSRINGFLVGVSMLAIAATGLLVPASYSDAQTRGMDRRDDRGDARDTRQGGRDEARDTKQECREGDSSRAECRQDKRDTKQDTREEARDVKHLD